MSVTTMPPVTPVQLALVKATLPRISQRPAQTEMAFRMHLARYAPAMGQRLPVCPATMLTNAVAVINHPGALRALVGGLAHELRASGMSPRGYMAIHAALMDTVCEHLSHNLELEEAYSDVIGTVLATMLAEAHGPRSHTMPLAA
ncbi:hypothetical protein K3728_05205 [Rhodobacteraceae bacterium M385]|nr:hypothetical protein K3728_05205 [Rhodobacteraceae bacterium M385]